MSTTTGEIATAIRPFHVEFSVERIDDLRRRIAVTRWPSNELVDDRSQGVQLAAAHANGRHGGTEADLTARQLEVLRLLADGLSPNEIAERLVISPKTVGAHVEHIFVKLGAHTRAQAVAHAFREHLLATA